MTLSEASRVVRDITGIAAREAHGLGGSVYEVELADGRFVVAKRHDETSAVHAEAASLEWLAAPAVVALPAVYGRRDRWLVMERIDSGPASAIAAQALGRGLAELHAAGAEWFGSAPPGGPADAWIGLAPMRNEPGPDWPTWYAEHRVAPYLRTAVNQGALDRSEASIIDTVCDRITELAPPTEPPSRLHGDLWSGNVLWASDSRAALIDPAAHGGHRETDLAMLRLFGCPHLDQIVAAYHERTPLPDGWRARVPLHQLFPLLVHTVLFGGGYALQAATAARQALRA